MLVLSGLFGSFFLKKYIRKCINKRGYVVIRIRERAKIGHKKTGFE